MRHSAALALGGWLALASAGAGTEGSASSGAGRDVQDFVFVGGAQSILVRVHIEIGGRPLTPAWRSAAARLHEYLDFNGTGTIRRDEELADLVEVISGPVTVVTRPTSPAGLDTTFAALDRHGDGALTTEERDEAATVLRRFDQNDDELVSSTELAAFRDPNAESSAQEAAGQMQAPARGGIQAEGPVLRLDRSGSRVQMVRQLLNRFDTGGPGGARAKDQRLSRSEIRLAAEVFRAFDQNRDGSLDSVELLTFLERAEPAVELIVRLGPRRPEEPAVEFVHPGRTVGPRVRLRRSEPSVVTMEIGDVWLDVRTVETAVDTIRARQVYEETFLDIDLDDSKSISLAEARGREPFQRLFRVLDRNGDGEIATDELNAALALFEDLWQGHAQLAVTDHGVQLFANLDTTCDGRLSLRELHAAPGQLAAFDRNGDGQLAAAEVPRRFEWSFAQAPLPLPLALALGGASGMPVRSGPHWFQQMDRNHDGELSPREFLGPGDAFRRLDSDRDGLIDAREAVAAGAGAGASAAHREGGPE
jgi:Ca2+-binding EF-hand superfamily protein